MTTASPKPTKNPWMSALDSVKAPGSANRRMTTWPQIAPISVMKMAYVRSLILPSLAHYLTRLPFRAGQL